MTEREYDALMAKLDAMMEKGNDTHNRLFVGNGQPSLVSRIQALEEADKRYDDRVSRLEEDVKRIPSGTPAASRKTKMIVAIVAAVLSSPGWALLLEKIF